MRSTLVQRLREIYVHALRLHIKPEELPDQDLLTVLGVDSVMVLEILITVETAFGIEIDNAHLSIKTLNSFDAFAAYLQAAHANDLNVTGE